MLKIFVKLPAALRDLDVAVLGQAAADMAVAHSAVRCDNCDSSPWVLEWLVEGDNVQHVIEARMRIAAELHHILLPDDLNFECEDVPNVDWLAHSYTQFLPFSVQAYNRAFFIYGAHYKDDVPDDQIALQIDAATAFGSGEHGTTAGCLEAMCWLDDQGACPWNVLDMGTGSGILGIAAWMLWKTPVLAVDNDAEAVRVADRHREANNVPRGASDMICACGDGFATPDVQRRKPFDLIIANILAVTLREMVRDVVGCADENGHVILSGILNEQAKNVLRIYEDAGLGLQKDFVIGAWTTLLLRKA